MPHAEAVKAAPRAAFFSFLIFLSAAANLSAQALLTDPNSQIYRDLDRWELRGLISPAFLLRPYPPELAKEMLAEVVERGTEAESAKASAYLAELSASSLRAGAAIETVGRAASGTESSSAGYAGDYGAFLRMNAEIRKNLWAVGQMSLSLRDVPSAGWIAPLSEAAPMDNVYSGGILPLSSLANGSLTTGLTIGSAIYAGDAGVMFGVGTSRSSFGPFWENGLVIGPQAPSAVNFTLQARYGAWRFSMGLFELVRGGDVPKATNKHVVMHSFSFAPTRKLDLGIFESVVWAARFEPIYLLPLADYFLLQDMSGYSGAGALGDNSLAGVYGVWRPIQGLAAKGLVYIDDLEFNQIVKGNFDTKWLFAGETGVEWAPEAGFLEMLAGDYTLVMPYMFTHYYTRDDTSLASRANNYQNNWTHYGKNWGPALLPNSDRLEIRANWALPKALSLGSIARLVRHGNASEGVYHADAAHDRAGDTQDGSMTDDGFFYVDGIYMPSYQQPYATGTDPLYARFLTQKVIETSLQGGLSLSWAGLLGKGSLQVSVRYLFEYIWNESVAGLGPVSGRDSARHYFGLSASMLF